MAYLPKERRSEGLMLNMSIRANIALPHLTGIQANAVRERQMAETLGRPNSTACRQLCSRDIGRFDRNQRCGGRSFLKAKHKKFALDA